MSVEGQGPGHRGLKSIQGRVPRGLHSNVTLPQSWVRSVRPMGKEGEWAGEEAGRQMRKLVRFLGRRVFRAEVWY